MKHGCDTKAPCRRHCTHKNILQDEKTKIKLSLLWPFSYFSMKWTHLFNVQIQSFYCERKKGMDQVSATFVRVDRSNSLPPWLQDVSCIQVSFFCHPLPQDNSLPLLKKYKSHLCFSAGSQTKPRRLRPPAERNLHLHIPKCHPDSDTHCSLCKITVIVKMNTMIARERWWR